MAKARKDVKRRGGVGAKARPGKPASPAKPARSAAKRAQAAALPPALQPEPKKKPDYTAATARFKGLAKRRPPTTPLVPMDLFRPAVPPPGVLPEGVRPYAMDEASQIPAAALWAGEVVGSAWAEGLVWPGYAYLSELAQRPEYRRMAEVLAKHCTKKWIRLKASSDDLDKSEEISAMEAELQRLKARDKIGTMVEQDAYFGRSHLYIDVNDCVNKREELKTSIGDGTNRLSKAKLRNAKLRLQNVEPIWTYPTDYNSYDPLQSDWYNPEQWFVMGKQLHKSRLITLVSREVPDILKPAYSFGGLSLSQMAQPYVDNWLRARQSVSDLISNFATLGLKTDLGESVQTDGQQLFQRAELFNVARSNAGLMLLQKGAAGEGEEFFQFAIPLSTLDELQAQAQEHMCAVAGYPVIILLGLTPHGLNASSEGEIRVFYDWIHAYQEDCLTPIVKFLLDAVQLSLFGEVDKDIQFEWVSLHDLTEKEKADLRKTDADTDVALVGAGILDPVESRKRLANDPDSKYPGLVIEDVPERPDAGMEPEQQDGDLGNLLDGSGLERDGSELERGEGRGQEGRREEGDGDDVTRSPEERGERRSEERGRISSRTAGRSPGERQRGWET